MEGIPALYLGKVISKDKFRAYIYATDGKSKLVNSWDEFEAHIETGIWFATIDDANNIKSQDVVSINKKIDKNESKPGIKK